MRPPASTPRSQEDGRRRDPSSSSGRTQLARLFQLIVAIQSDRFYNARQLAELCEVSRRTIFRDLDTLEAAGIPIQYRPERQGYQLAKGFFLAPLHLEEKEALALSVLARQWKGGDGLGLLRDARAGVVKLVQALPADIRSRVQSGSEPFDIDANPPDPPGDRQLLYDAVLEALTRRLQLRIWFQDATHQAPELTVVSPYRILQARGVWYLVGRSTLHREVRAFRIPRILQAQVTERPYTIPPRFSLERVVRQAWAAEPGPVRYEIGLRFSPEAAPEIRATVWHPGQRLVPHADGHIDLHLVIDGLDEILGWILSYGDQVEVIGPEALRERVGAVAHRVAQRYAERGSSLVAERTGD